MKKINYIVISIILCFASICVAFQFHNGGGNKTVKTVFADTVDTSPPVIDTSALELWDGTANIAWYVDNPAAGTQLNPYIISNARELAGLSEIVALGDGDTIAYDNGAASPTYGKVGNNYASNGAVATTDFNGKFIELSNNIYLNAWNGDAAMDADDFSNANNGGTAINWNPISYFAGIFDGNDKKIVGFFQSKGDYCGVFGRIVKSATIKNLTVASGNITSSVYYGYMGGIVGQIEYNGSGVTITNCVNYGNIATTTSYSYSGGIAGYISGGTTTITDCVNYGNITTTYSSYASSSGGIVGYISDEATTITDCVNYGNIIITITVTTVSSSFSNYTGGIVGYNIGGTTMITDCLNYGNITFSHSYYYSFFNCTGGIVGYISGGTTTITDCLNYGNITTTTTSSSSSYSGGIAGYNIDSKVLRCINNGEISTSYTGASESCTGGITGYNANGGIIAECYNTAAVLGKFNTGGIAGRNSADNLYTKINGCYNTGGISGTDNVGGIVGNNTATTYSATNIAGVSFSYNAGTVSGTTNVGGVIGYDDKGTIRYCYYDTTVASGISAFGVGGSATVFGRTTAQMKSSGVSFGSGFASEFINASNDDGEIIWKAINGEYPQLNYHPTYTVTVTNGTGGGGYVESATVNIVANAAPQGNEFDRWITSDGIAFDNANNASTFFTMPSNAVSVAATYKDITYTAPPYEYTVTGGGNGAWAKDSADGFTITCDGGYAKFSGVKVNGGLIAFNNYTVISGSTIVTLKAAYLAALPEGTHTVEIVFTDGSVQTNLTIQASGGGNQSDPGANGQESGGENPSNPDATDISEITIEFEYQSGANMEYTDGKYYYKRTGNPIQPKIKILYPSSWGYNAFVQNRDFTISYSDNINVGKGALTVTGIGNYKGAKTAQFDIVQKLPSEIATEQRQQEYKRAEQKSNRTTRVIIATVICGTCAGYSLIKILKLRRKKKEKSEQPDAISEYLKTTDMGRTAKQKELFYKSERYLQWKERSEAALPIFSAYIRRISIFALALSGLSVLTFGLAFAGGVSYGFCGVCAVMLIICIAMSARAKKYDSSENYSLDVASITSGADVCDKCAGDYELFWDKSKFLRKDTRSETQTLKEGATPYLSEYDEVINMQRVRRTRTVGSGDTKRTEVYFEDVYNIKRVSYWYNVPATCKDCGEAVVLERKGRDPAETADTATHIHVENMNVDNVETVQIQQPEPLPPVFCPFCNGKNKGEATKCEHCGGKI